mgnify:CR=1 FL=1
MGCGMFQLLVIAGTTIVAAGEPAKASEKEPLPVWVDVRTKEEFKAGHVPGAVNITHTAIRKGIARCTDDKERLIVLYCHSGYRAALAMADLWDMGYKNVVNLGSLESALAAARKAEAPILPPEVDPDARDDD